MHPEFDNEVLEVEVEEVLPEPEPKVTTEELVYIYSMIKSVASGAWGETDEQVQNLLAAGFEENQIYHLLAAVDERSRAG